MNNEYNNNESDFDTALEWIDSRYNEICTVCDPKDYGPYDNDYHSDQLLMEQ